MAKYLHDLVVIHPNRSELAVKIGEPRVKIDCIHINLYGLDWLLKDASCNEMCHYFHSRLLEKCKEFGIFFVRKTKYITVDAWVCFRFVPPLFCSFFSFPFIIKSILISNKTPTSEGVLKLPARASGFEARNGFPVPQNITYSVRYQGGSLL